MKGLVAMRRPDEEWRHYDLALTFGITLILSMILGYFGGRVADRYLGIDPYGGLVGILLGVIAAFRSLWRDLQRVPQRGQPFHVKEEYRNRLYEDDEERRRRRPEEDDDLGPEGEAIKEDEPPR